MPESPRWLVYKDRPEEAIKILAEHHAGGNLTSPLVTFEMAEITAAIEAEKAQSSTKFSTFISSSEKIPTYHPPLSHKY
jgi:hypothetical protein